MAAERSRLWNDLPCVIVVEIFSLLPVKDRLNASSTCKAWRECLFHPSLWQNVVFRVNSCDNRTTHRGIESAQFLANHCGRFVRNVVIEVNSLNPHDVQKCKEILEVLVYNSNLRALCLRPSSCRLEWVDSTGYTVLDQYISVLCRIILKAQKLQHISLGCIQEILDNGDALLVLLAQHHGQCLKSLHISSVKEDPDNYVLIEINPNTFDPFCNLEALSIDYDNISDELLLVLSKPHKKALRFLNIHVHGIDKDSPGTTDAVWAKVCEHSPCLEITMTLLHSHDLSNNLHDILHPSMPLTHFRSYFSSGLDAEFLDIVAALNNNSLNSLTLVESINEEDMTPTGTLHATNEDPLVMLAWRCKKLSQLTIIGYDICGPDLIAIARLRGSDLKEFKVPSCCILVASSDNEFQFLDSSSEEVYCGILNEVSSSLGKLWVPMTNDEIPPSVCNVNMDADGTYLNQLLSDQKWQMLDELQCTAITNYGGKKLPR